MTYSNFAAAQIALYDRAVLPQAKFLLSQLGNALLYRYGEDWKRYEITIDEKDIPALITRRLENGKVLSSIAVNTDNEIRAEIGYDSMEGGDVVYKPSNMIPAVEDDMDESSSETLTEDELKANLRSRFSEEDVVRLMDKRRNNG